MSYNFDAELYAFNNKIGGVLGKIDDNQKEKISEIRLRTGQPLSVTVEGKSFFVGVNSCLKSAPHNMQFTVFQSDINDSIRIITNNSIYAHTEQLNEGFLPMKYGHRAGVTGNFSGNNLCEFTSLNIRIARQIIGCAEPLFNGYRGGILIAGPPSSGKTTLLRDMVRLLSLNGKRVAVLDTRGEISAACHGNIYNDLGPNTDVLYGIEKEKGIEIALRVLSPDIIAFDEIGTPLELKGIENSLYGGSEVLTTAHIGNLAELKNRQITRELLHSSAIKTLVLLDKERNTKIFDCKEIKKCLLP